MKTQKNDELMVNKFKEKNEIISVGSCWIALVSLRCDGVVIFLLFQHFGEDFDELAGFSQHSLRLIQFIFQHCDSLVKLLVLDQ